MTQVKRFLIALVVLLLLVSVHPQPSSALSCAYRFGPEYFSCNDGKCDFLYRIGFESTGNWCDSIDTLETTPSIDPNLSKEIITARIPKATGIFFLKYQQVDSSCPLPFQTLTPLTSQQIKQLITNPNCLNHFKIEQVTSTNDNQSISSTKNQILKQIENQQLQTNHKKTQSLIQRLIPLILFISVPLVVVIFSKSTEKTALRLLCILPFQFLYYLSTFIFGYVMWDYWRNLDIIFPKIYVVVIVMEVLYISLVIFFKKWKKQH